MNGPPETLRAHAEFSSSVLIGLLLPTLLVFVVLLAHGVPFCCDSQLYLDLIGGYRRDGLFFQHVNVGYRAYLFPYLYSLIPFDSSATAFGDVRVYSIISITLFLLIEFGVLLRLRGSVLFWSVYLGVFVNPLLLVYIPYPLQESFVVLMFAALVPWLLQLDYRRSSWHFPGLLGVFFGVMYMARPSHVVIALPVAVLLTAHLRDLPAARNLSVSVAAFGVPVLLLVAPQSAISLRHLDTIAPYPPRRIFSRQIELGQAYAKYATNVSGRENIGAPMPHWNPLNCESSVLSFLEPPRNKRRFACSLETASRRDGLEALVFTGLIHVFNGLDYHTLKPFITDVDIPLFSGVQLLSMAIVFLGGYGAIRKLVRRTADARDWFLITIVGTTLAVTTIVAVETRFGVLATAALSLLATELALNGKMDAREWVPLSFGLAFFLAVSSLLSIYVLALSGAVAP